MANPFDDPSDRKFRRSSNGRSFFDEDESTPSASPNNPFYDNTRPGIYKRGGYRAQTNGNSSHRQELFGDETEPKSKSLFNDEDDEEFDVDKPFDAEEYRQTLLMKKIRDSANRQMNSQQRSLAVIEDSEQMGVTTAEELLRQREQLDNVERKTGDINKTMDVSTKHVDKISSIFSGVKSWFKKKEEIPEEPQIPQRDSGLRDTVESYRVSSASIDKSQHPAVRMRDADLAKQSSTQAPGKMTSRQVFAEYDDHFNRNLGMMSDGLSRLKGLGLVMQTEIETQNEQVERINQNVAKADDKVVLQTKRINNMLKK